MVEVSVIVVTYNAIWEKLSMTIQSILTQKNVKYEIVFSDDGSHIKWNDKIKKCIPKYVNYKFSDSEINVGTVSNIINGLNCASGKFIKVLSPGDCFNCENALRTWLDCIIQSGNNISFSDAVYYRNVNGQINKIEGKASPTNINLYQNNAKKSKLFVDYLIANDTILGATVLGEKNFIKKYLYEMEGKIKYAEDFMLRLMVFDDCSITHVNKNLILYEYGEGISTNGNEKWSALIKKDFDATNQIIKTRKNLSNSMQRKYQKYLNNLNGFIPNKFKKLFYFPTTLIFRLKMKYFFRKTII